MCHCSVKKMYENNRKSVLENIEYEPNKFKHITKSLVYDSIL